MEYLSGSWCGLPWSEWINLKNEENELRRLPTSPGVYRIRPIGRDFLVYIGQTGRSLRERMGQLRVYTRSEAEMPFNDPHTAAPSLWAWRDAEGWNYECSVAPVSFDTLSLNDSKQMREGLESYLLWIYRCERGESTLCNFGRFHPRYFKSSSRKSEKRGGSLPIGEENYSGGPSLPPLKQAGDPTDSTWMGLDWSDPIVLIPGCGRYLENKPGLYRIISRGEVVYIGQSLNLKTRIQSHIHKKWGNTPNVSVHITNEQIRGYQLHEWENDLIGGFFAEYRRPPKFQFINSE